MNNLPNTIRRLIPDEEYTDEQIKTMYWLLFEDSISDSERSNILDFISTYRSELAKEIAREVLEMVTAAM